MHISHVQACVNIIIHLQNMIHVLHYNDKLLAQRFLGILRKRGLSRESAALSRESPRFLRIPRKRKFLKSAEHIYQIKLIYQKNLGVADHQ